MTTPTPQPTSPETKSAPQPPGILRCLSGSAVAGTFSFLIYLLMSAIAQSFASKPITSTNITVVNITVAVRTLVVGIVALGAAVFGIAALGLLLLSIQLLIQRFSKDKALGS